MPLIAIGFLEFSVVDIIDIAMVAALIFLLIRWVRHTSAMNIVAAIIVLLVIRVIADLVGMRMMSTILGALIDVGAIALVVIFQPEIRQFLYNLGRRTVVGSEGITLFERIFGRRSREMNADSLDEVAKACFEMGEEKVGALIVIPGHDNIDEIINTGDIVDAQISKPLIENIFFKNSPLHDGAVIMSADRIVAARCTLPISGRTDIPARYGMSHKAAVGISERTDARVIVVSEQTGRVSIVREGKITPANNINTFKLLLSNDERKAGGEDRV
ncbi:MAG: diadenylate cyclase CdaA [Bacteroidales bacterium]|nr:diadenylate cyclase CdaA [Candidatus Cryptobacteroides aphodequi]